MAPRRTYTAEECADMLGMSVDTFYQQREALHDVQGMPRSAGLGRIRIPIQAFEAWLNRDHPMSARRQPWTPPANDPVPLDIPQSGAQHRAHLAQVYGRR